MIKMTKEQTLVLIYGNYNMLVAAGLPLIPKPQICEEILKEIFIVKKRKR